MRKEIIDNAEILKDSDIGLAEESKIYFEFGEYSQKEQFPTMQDIIDVLKNIHDPEIPINIYELGLIYDVQNDPYGNIDIVMTLTTPNCPVAGSLPLEVAEKVSHCQGVGRVRVNITWTPPWQSDMMSEDAKMAMGFL